MQVIDAVPPGSARLHYHRPDRKFSHWAVYSFGDTEEPTGNFNDGPTFPAEYDSFGAYFDIRLTTNAQNLGFIIHNLSTGAKDPGPDMYLDVAAYKEAWIVAGDQTVYTTKPGPPQLLAAGFSRLQAFWINRTKVAIQRAYLRPGWTYALVYSSDASLEIMESGSLTGGASLPLTLAPDGFTPGEAAQYPHLADYAVFHLPNDPNTADLHRVLQAQLVLTGANAAGAIEYLTGVQHAGVLDDMFSYPGTLGPVFSNYGVNITVWAPTAQSVCLLLFDQTTDVAPSLTVTMKASNGVWSATVDNSWEGKYYLFDVSVYVPGSRAILHNLVTDPYSVDLALNGTKTRLTNLDGPAAKPADWDQSVSPHLSSLHDLSLYELHVRDFSVADNSVPEEYRGTYLAFTNPGTNGMRHLQHLAQAGLKAVHLLPTFHFSSVNEDKSTWQYPQGLSRFPPDGEQQQAAIAQLQHVDPYNWGYDPVHFLAPTGAYACNPGQRVLEYRQMVLTLHNIGLRVVQDMVFNHTFAHGQVDHSVLDKIVPNYYYRLNADGLVENSSCCPNTASQHGMLEKLMIDNMVQNARHYKIDGFRFDLMGLHFVYNFQRIQQALAQLTIEKDGVDGSKIYLYGEGWNMGETADDAMGPNARQINMHGTSVGTFNDRVRDAIRGGSGYLDSRTQGFATGLFTDASLWTSQNHGLSHQRNVLLAQTDWIRSALAGNLRDFTFEDSHGRQVKGSDLRYGDQPVAYAASPLEVLNYCSVHDNQTLFDVIQLKSAIPGTTPAGGDSIQMRTRRQVLAMSLIALGQGIPFFLAADDLLRSKSMDHNSYNSGDWFNQIEWISPDDPARVSTNWGIGLPLASENQSQWPLMRPLLANPALAPTAADISACAAAFEMFLRIRYSSRLFRMETLAEIQNNLHFLNTGPLQIPGLIVMKLAANGGNYGTYNHMVVVFNATTGSVQYQNEELKNVGLFLHPLQSSLGDEETKASQADSQAGSVTVSGLTTAVFVAV